MANKVLGSGFVRAVNTCTIGTAPTNAETCVIGSKTYTFRATLGTLDGSIRVRATTAFTAADLAAAINLTGTAGTTYGLNMTKHPSVYAVDNGNSTVTIKAKVFGEIGNSIACTVSTSIAGWAAAAMANGAGGDSYGGITTAIDTIKSEGQINSDVLKKLADLYVDLTTT